LVLKKKQEMMKSVVAVVATLLLVSVCVDASSRQLLNGLDLPGGYSTPYDMWTGYVTVDENAGRNLFYWFIQADNDHPFQSPLVFWYQGGPGCSGLNGLLSENGPFQVGPKGDSLGPDDISWNKVANVIYLEQPAGVGFSYSKTPADYQTNDTRAAQDNFAFLEGWLKLFPEYAHLDLWLTGESYGGVYIPMLSEQMVNNPNSISARLWKGLMVGNPVFRCDAVLPEYLNQQFNLFYWHGLVSYTNYYNWTVTWKCTDSANSGSDACQWIYNNAQAQIGVIDQELKQQQMEFNWKKSKMMLNKRQTKTVTDDNLPSLDPDCLYQDFCTGNGTLDFSIANPDTCVSYGQRMKNYLNNQQLISAIGAVNPPGGWSACTNSINYTMNGGSMDPIYRKVFAQRPDVHVLVYSGDIDIATVPFTFTQTCLAQLPGRPTKLWSGWYVNRATAGYWEQYDTYTYATIKGAGHEAPQYQPLNSYEMFTRFLANQKL
jgi:carboxypeptidase C (cathepsin A)